MAEQSKPLVNKKQINLAMFGMTEGNGHPYSWTAIFNGFNRQEMVNCPFPAIPGYLYKEPQSVFPYPDVRVTHIWCDDAKDAEHVAKLSLIPNVVKRPEDVIGQVDAVIVATDIGSEHVRRCRPFVEAGLPIFVDKPMVDNEQDLRIFSKWIADGAHILSSSAMHYCKEYQPYHNGQTHELGDLRVVHVTMNKKWETYGIHALQSMYAILGPGFISARNTGSFKRNMVHIKHSREVDIMIMQSYDMLGGSGMHLCGTASHVGLAAGDTFYCFKSQLLAFIDYLRTGRRPFPYSETVELMKLVIAGIRSREEGGREVMLDEISAI